MTQFQNFSIDWKNLPKSMLHNFNFPIASILIVKTERKVNFYFKWGKVWSSYMLDGCDGSRGVSQSGQF
jgi:hypothetical protein